MHACADRDEISSQLTKMLTPPHPIVIETPSYRRPSGRLQAAGRPSEGRCAKSAMRIRRFASLFGEMLLYQHQRIVTMTKVYIASNNLPVEIIPFRTIGFSDLLSRIRNSTTTGRPPLRVYHGPFISEDRSFDLSTALFHVTCTMSHGKSVQAPIRL